RPLENDLSQAFSSISLDGLDSFAQTLDFGSWDQTIQNQQAEAPALENAEAVLQVCTQPTQLVSPYSTISPYYTPPLAAVRPYFTHVPSVAHFTQSIES